jgi:hypothetical protein
VAGGAAVVFVMAAGGAAEVAVAAGLPQAVSKMAEVSRIISETADNHLTLFIFLLPFLIDFNPFGELCTFFELLHLLQKLLYWLI